METLLQQHLATFKSLDQDQQQQWYAENIILLEDYYDESTEISTLKILLEYLTHFYQIHPHKKLHKLIQKVKYSYVIQSINFNIDNKLGLGKSNQLENIALYSVFIFLLLLIIKGFIPNLVFLTLETIICGVLLIEFSIRIFFAKKYKFYYFKQHIFTHFIPAIPFGTIAFFTHSMAWTQATTLLRLIRPIMTIYRMLLLSIRSFDSLVRQNKALLDKDILVQQAKENLPTKTSIYLQEVADNLSNIKAQELENTMGRHLSQHLYKMRFIARIPPFRWIPFFNDILPKNMEEAIHNIAARLQGINQFIQSIFDLKGVITKAELLRWVGETFAEKAKPAFNRARSLTIFTLLFSIILYFLNANTSIAALWNPLGGAAMVTVYILIITGFFYYFGLWIKYLVNVSLEKYKRIVEVQKPILAEYIQEHFAYQAFSLLKQNVFIAEEKIFNCNLLQEAENTEQAIKNLEENTDYISSIFYQNLLFIRHNRSIPFISSITADQLLSDSHFNQFLQENLHFSIEKEMLKGVNKLFFQQISKTLPLEAAKLLEEYNQYALPIYKENLLNQEQKEQYQQWLENKLQLQNTEINLNITHLTPASFELSDFLIPNPEREQWIEKNYGEKVLQAIYLDRKKLIHRLFSTHLLEKSHFNFYKFYWQNIGNGKILILPIIMLVKFFQFLIKASQWLIKTIQEFLSQKTKEEVEIYTNYSIARRQVHRLRKPLFMLLTHLRAKMDMEYHGIALYQQENSLPIAAQLQANLQFIQASFYEKKPFINLKMPEISALLQNYFNDYSPDFNLETLRAITIAFSIDYKNCRSYYESYTLLQNMQHILEQKNNMPSWLQTLQILFKHYTKLAYNKKYRQEFHQLHQWWPQQDFIDKKLFIKFKAYWTANRYNLQKVLKLVYTSNNLVENTQQILQEISLNPHYWTENLIKIRILHTLSLLDIYIEENLIKALGKYQ